MCPRHNEAEAKFCSQKYAFSGWGKILDRLLKTKEAPEVPQLSLFFGVFFEDTRASSCGFSGAFLRYTSTYPLQMCQV